VWFVADKGDVVTEAANSATGMGVRTSEIAQAISAFGAADQQPFMAPDALQAGAAATPSPAPRFVAMADAMRSYDSNGQAVAALTQSVTPVVAVAALGLSAADVRNGVLLGPS
jgi:hypothetical protein